MAASLLLASPAHTAPRRVASLNLCTDELLLLIADPQQIASITHLGRQPAETPLARLARRYPHNDGSLLSVVGLKPDLVLTMGGGARDRIAIAHRLRIPVLNLPFPQTLADIAASIGQVSSALRRPERGRAILSRLAELQRSKPARPLDTIWLGGGGRSMSGTGLAAQWMGLAGLRQRPLRGDRVSLEQLLIRPPQVLLRSDYRSGQYSAEQRWLSHPLAGGTRRSRTIRTDGRPWTCMGPLMLDEVSKLRRQVVR